MIGAAIFGLLTALLWGTGDFLTRKPMKTVGYYFMTGYMMLFGFIILALLAVAEGSSFQALTAQPSVLALTMVAGILNFLGILFMYRGFSAGLMSIVSPVASSYPAVTVLVSVFFFGQMLGWTLALGIAFVIAGVSVSSFKFNEKGGVENKGAFEAESQTEIPPSTQRVRLVKGVDFALVSFFSFGMQYVIMGQVTPVFGLILPLVVIRGSGAATTFLCYRPLRKAFIVPPPRLILLLVLIGALNAGGYLALDQGLLVSSADLPIVVTLSSMGSVVVVTLARAFYGERLALNQAVGVLSVIVGVVVIANL